MASPLRLGYDARMRLGAPSLVLALLLGASAGCSQKHEGDVPLTVTNVPTCRTSEPAWQIVLRIERGDDFVQQAVSPKMFASSGLAGRSVKVKAGLCRLGDSCANVNFVRTVETTVRGGDAGLTVEMPKLEVPCADGTIGSN